MLSMVMVDEWRFVRYWCLLFGYDDGVDGGVSVSVMWKRGMLVGGLCVVIVVIVVNCLYR